MSLSPGIVTMTCRFPWLLADTKPGSQDSFTTPQSTEDPKEQGKLESVTERLKQEDDVKMALA